MTMLPPLSGASVVDSPGTFEMEGTTPDEEFAAGSTHVWEVTNAPNPMGMAISILFGLILDLKTIHPKC